MKNAALKSAVELVGPLAPAAAPEPSFRAKRVAQLETVNGRDPDKASHQFAREIESQLNRLRELAPIAAERISDMLDEAERLTEAAHLALSKESDRVGQFRDHLQHLAQQRAELVVTEQSLTASKELLDSPSSLDAPGDVLALAVQRVKFLPDQVSKRKKQISELAECVHELSDGLDVPKIVEEHFKTSDGAVRGWHRAGHFVL